MKKQLFALTILALFSQFLKAQIQQSDTSICAGARLTLTVDIPQNNGVTCTDNVFNPNLSYGTVTDIEGNTYKTIVIGTQEWMAENLRTATYNNGDLIPHVVSNADWAAIWNNGSPTEEPAWCYYGNDSSYNCPYGKLYNWYAITDPRGICPVGWHVPTDQEWDILRDFLDPNAIGNTNNNAGGQMKSTGTLQAATGLWKSPNTAATNSSGFSGIPGGFRYNYGSFNSIGDYGEWWSSTENTIHAWYRGLGFINNYVNRSFNYKNYGCSCRCLKD